MIDVVYRLLFLGLKVFRGCFVFCIFFFLWWFLFDLGLIFVLINWVSFSCEMYFVIYGEERKCINKYKSKVNF